MKHLRWLIVPAVGAVAAGGYYFLKANHAAWPTWMFGEQKITVSIAPVRRGSLPAVIQLSGELSAARETNIRSRLAGKVIEVSFKDGDSVAAGAVVAIIDSGALATRTTEIEAALNAARKDLKSSQEQAARADEHLGQNREWQRQNLIARRDLEQAEAAAETARAQAELARANLAQQESMLAQARTLQSLTRLSAPFSGIIIRRWVEPGAGVGESDPVLTIADPSKLKFTANYAGPHSEEIRPGMKVEISSPAASDGDFAARVARVESAAEGEKQLLHIVIDVDNPQQSLRPGMAAQVSIELAKREDVLLVPRSAVISLEGKNYVYKSVDGRAVRQEVTLGTERGEEVSIKFGVNDGESIIVDNQDSLKPNIGVRVVTAPVPIRFEPR